MRSAWVSAGLRHARIFHRRRAAVGTGVHHGERRTENRNESTPITRRAGDFDTQDVAKLKEHDDYSAEDIHSDHP